MNALKKIIRSLVPEKYLMHLQALDHYLNGEDEIRLLGVLCSVDRDAIDAGANIGTYSYFLRKKSRHVYAYEPNPGLATRLERLLPDISLRNLALSDSCGDVVLQVPADSDGRPIHELASIAQDFSGPVQNFTVKAITLDSENFDNIGFIKIDVEQHERQVLLGALQTIKRCRPVIMTEVSPLKYEANLQTVFQFITQEKYVGWFKFAKKWREFDELDPDLHVKESNFLVPDGFMGNNVIFFPAEHPNSKIGPKP